MAIILGLDASTAVVGVCVVDSEVTPDASGSHILLLDRIEFKGCKTIWEKADRVKGYLEDLANGDARLRFRAIDRITLEEPLMGFRTGMSSAQTITTLMRFNGICSYIARSLFFKEPEYVSAPHARKLCGIKLVKTAVGGPQKEQVYAHMMTNDLKHVKWPTKKSGNVVDWSRDACDAYVIARSAAINGKFVPAPKKLRKPKKAPETI